MKKPAFKIVTIWPSRSWAVCDVRNGKALAYFSARVLAETYARNLNKGII